jgi:hypothetical protein
MMLAAALAAAACGPADSSPAGPTHTHLDVEHVRVYELPEMSP